MSVRGAVIAAVTSAVLVAAAAPVASAAPAIGVGVAIDASTSTAAADRQIDAAKSSGASLIRLGVSWSALEPAASGEHDPATLAAVDHAVATATARGLKVVLFMFSTPCWASSAPAASPGCTQNDLSITRYGPRDPSDNVPVSTFLAARYGARLAAFEVWNEPDQANELYWAGPDKVVRYVALAKALYKPLKAANPKMKVLAGAFVGYDGRWLKALYAAGIKGSYDALSVHFYDLTLWGVRLTRAVQKQYGDRANLWVAETGWTSCAPAKTYLGHRCVSRAAQARFTADLIASVRRRANGIAALLIYTAQDQPGEDFGLLDVAGRPKPVLAAMRRADARRAPRVRPVTLKVSRAGARLVASGSSPAADILELTARKSGKLVYRYRFKLDRVGRYRIALPAAIGTRGLTVQVHRFWLNERVSRRV